MLRNWLITNVPRKRTISDSAENIDESSAVNEPTNIIVPSNKGDQQQANEPHPQPHRKDMPVQRPNPLFRRKNSQDFMTEYNKKIWIGTVYMF